MSLQRVGVPGSWGVQCCWERPGWGWNARALLGDLMGGCPPPYQGAGRRKQLFGDRPAKLRRWENPQSEIPQPAPHVSPCTEAGVPGGSAIALKLHPKGPPGLAPRAGCWLHPLPAFSRARNLQALVGGLGEHLCSPKRSLRFLSWGKWAERQWASGHGQPPGWNSVWLLLGELLGKEEGRPRPFPHSCGFPSSFTVTLPGNAGASAGIHGNVTALWHLRGPLVRKWEELICVTI